MPRSNTSLRTFLKDLGIEGNGAKDDVIYQGGPLELGRPFVVHTSDYTIEGTNVGLAGLAVTVKRDVFHAIAAGKGPRRFLVALGRAGWGAGQLERELSAGVWVVVMADEGLVFEPDNDKKWDRAFDRGAHPALYARR